MFRQVFLIIVIFFSGLSSVYAADKCVITLAEEQTFILMPYQDFDQTPLGWRRIAKQGCYHQSAIIIDMYLAKNKSKLLDWQVKGLVWHAGQMYAFNSQYDIAKDRFKAALYPKEPASLPIRWNAYVNATIAFLDKNMAQLQYNRAIIAAGSEVNGKIPNLDVVDALILNFDKPYSVAYCKAP